MAVVLKCILGLFILTGIAVSFYGCRELLATWSFVRNAEESSSGAFLGYVRQEVVSRSSSPSSTNWGEQNFTDTTSYMSYPEFEVQDREGRRVRIVGNKQHLIERFRPGQQVRVLVSSRGDYRLADFYSLYSLDLCILALGFCFILVPAIIWNIIVNSLQTPAGSRMAERFGAIFTQFLNEEAGPFRVITILKATAVLVILAVVAALAGAVAPYVKQLRPGGGYALIESLEKKRFDEARELIAREKGINKLNEYNQSPLLLALEANRFDLARLLIEAGADVNIKSRMYMTPLCVAAQAGDLETVRLLLSRGASPDVPEDETPPAVYAIVKGHDDIARLIIESGCDLHKRYMAADGPYTIGDITVTARKPGLTEIVDRRGGSFTRSPLQDKQEG